MEYIENELVSRTAGLPKESILDHSLDSRRSVGYRDRCRLCAPVGALQVFSLVAYLIEVLSQIERIYLLWLCCKQGADMHILPVRQIYLVL